MSCMGIWVHIEAGSSNFYRLFMKTANVRRVQVGNRFSEKLKGLGCGRVVLYACYCSFLHQWCCEVSEGIKRGGMGLHECCADEIGPSICRVTHTCLVPRDISQV